MNHQKVKELVELFKQADLAYECDNKAYVRDISIREIKYEKNNIVLDLKYVSDEEYCIWYISFTEKNLDDSYWKDQVLYMYDDTGVSTKLKVLKTPALFIPDESEIIVEVRGGVAYCNDLRVKIIDHD